MTLRVEYDAAADLLADYTDNLSHGGTFVATGRELPPGTEVRLVLSFPNLLEPIALDAVVRWSRGDGDPGDPRTMSRLVRVLIVEDNPHVATFLSDGLTGSGRRAGDVAFIMREASNGKDALELLRTEPFDLLIIDVYLPVLDGVHVIAAARELGLRDLPVVAVSAGGDGARIDALTAGANMFLDKPMRLRQVIETVRSLMKL